MRYRQVIIVCHATLPPGFTAVDVLALGALGHIIGAGIILGLRATGGI